jgi:hypothetical protein
LESQSSSFRTSLALAASTRAAQPDPQYLAGDRGRFGRLHPQPGYPKHAGRAAAGLRLLGTWVTLPHAAGVDWRAGLPDPDGRDWPGSDSAPFLGLLTSVQLSLFTVLYTLVVLIALEVWVKPRLFNHRQYNPIVTVVILIALANAFGFIGIIAAPPLSAAIQILWSRLVIHRDGSLL